MGRQSSVEVHISYLEKFIHFSRNMFIYSSASNSVLHCSKPKHLFSTLKLSNNCTQGNHRQVCIFYHQIFLILFYIVFDKILMWHNVIHLCLHSFLFYKKFLVLRTTKVFFGNNMDLDIYHILRIADITKRFLKNALSYVLLTPKAFYFSAMSNLIQTKQQAAKYNFK